MPLFLTDHERISILDGDDRTRDFLWALRRRVEKRAAKPGLLSGDETADWWRPVAEYLTDAAMVEALSPSEATGIWLRDVTLSLVRRPQDDWVGPHYRNHLILDDDSQIGHLETAHFCWAVAIVLDLASDVFTKAEYDEVGSVLRNRGIPMCINWLDREHTAANWWCVLSAGLTVAAAVLNDEPSLIRARTELAGCSALFQTDGSYGESLQYGNYAAYTLMLASEALRRRGEETSQVVPIDRYIGYVRWAVASHLYSRPAGGWGPADQPRALNFNDSAAMFKPTADLLLHLSARGADHPVEAGLARDLFERTYGGRIDAGPHDQASFGLRTDWGFLTLPLLSQASGPLSPSNAGMSPMLAFDCGDTIARDAWNGRTVGALHGGGELLKGPGHFHHDLNSVVLVHNDERLLVDAGHSCYRNAGRRLELSTEMHNTCTFIVTRRNEEDTDQSGGFESGSRSCQIQQGEPGRRIKRGDCLDGPIDRGARRLIAAQLDDLRVLGSDAAAAYGAAIERFARIVILCGSHVVFIIDHIRGADPVRTQWNWLFNNRDGTLDLKIAGTDRIVARRGRAGMKLFSTIKKTPELLWAHVHDAYHCMPGQMGEGRPGSGVLIRWSDPVEQRELVAIHTVALDGYGTIAGWHLKPDHASHGEEEQPEVQAGLESPGARSLWMVHASSQSIRVEEQSTGRSYRLFSRDDSWNLTRTS